MSEQQRVLVLVTGSARSGTSSLAGCMHHLGLHVPPPWVGARERNPKGHFETRPVIAAHKEALAALRITENPAAPDVLDRIAGTPAEAALRAMLIETVAEQDAALLAFKDPHARLFIDTWRATAEATGRSLRVLITSRHPAEVIASRYAAWGGGREEQAERRRRIRNLVGWINQSLYTERATRGLPRAFVPYDDLVGDWRSTLGRALAQTGLDLDLDAAADQLDGFLDTDLQRSHRDWDDVPAAAELIGLADETWSAVAALTERPDAASVAACLDELAARYAVRYAEAEVMVAEVEDARREALREKFRARNAQLREHLAQAREQAAPVAGSPDSQVGRLADIARRTARSARRRRPPEA